MNNKALKYKKLYYVLMIVVILVSFIPLIVIGVHNRPSADDFNYAIDTFKTWNETHSVYATIEAAVQTSVRFWHTWQGLYASAFLLSLQPAIFGSKWYALTGIIMLFLIAGSAVIFSCYVLKRLFKRTWLEGIALGLAMSFLMIQYMPSCVEGLYWFNGAVNYGFFYAALLIFICLLIELQRTNSIRKEAMLLILCLFSVFVLEGGNHVTALMTIVSIFVVSVVRCRNDKRHTLENIGILITALAFLYLNLSSPGTQVRIDALGEDVVGNMNIFWVAFRSMWEAARNVGDWFGLKEIILIILTLPIFIDLTKYIRSEYKFTFRYPLAVIIGSVAWLSIMYCPPFYAAGGCGADRLINIVYYSFVILLFVTAAYITGWFQNIISEKDFEKIQLTNLRYLQTILVLTFALFLSSVLKTWSIEAFTELYTGEARIYSEEYDSREKELFKSTGEDVVVSSFNTKPQLLFFDDITVEKDNWKNTGVSKYYEIKSIRIEE